jgi:hypothetical protein
MEPPCRLSNTADKIIATCVCSAGCRICTWGGDGVAPSVYMMWYGHIHTAVATVLHLCLDRGMVLQIDRAICMGG